MSATSGLAALGDSSTPRSCTEPHASSCRVRPGARVPTLGSCLLMLLCLPGCAGTQRLETRLSELRTLTHKARAQGAYRCAPEELAQSEAQLEFAARELDQGDPARAREHLVLAASNAKAALHLSADAACSAPSPSAPEAHHLSNARAIAAVSCAVGPRSALTNHAARPMKRPGSTKEHAAI